MNLKENGKLKEVLLRSYQKVPLVDKVLKFQEELGEFTRVFLKYNNSVNKTQGSIDNVQNALIEEIIDIYLVWRDILEHLKIDLNVTDEEILKILERKVDKWSQKL
jgi:NTP pyrophosphatase (non-canonical NTP hydrolase)